MLFFFQIRRWLESERKRFPSYSALVWRIRSMRSVEIAWPTTNNSGYAVACFISHNVFFCRLKIASLLITLMEKRHKIEPNKTKSTTHSVPWRCKSFPSTELRRIATTQDVARIVFDRQEPLSRRNFYSWIATGPPTHRLHRPAAQAVTGLPRLVTGHSEANRKSCIRLVLFPSRFRQIGLLSSFLFSNVRCDSLLQKLQCRSRFIMMKNDSYIYPLFAYSATTWFLTAHFTLWGCHLLV